MPRLIRVSFDYDGTLTLKEFADYAKNLRARGFDPWIVTQRDNPRDMREVKKLAKDLLLNLEHVVSTRGLDKYVVLRHIQPVWHIDDDPIQVQYIKAILKRRLRVEAIHHPSSPEWHKKCEALLAKHMDQSGFAKRDIGRRFN